MTNELTKNLMCICMRNGVQIWIEKERIMTLQSELAKLTGSKFILFEEQVINTADIVGIFTPQSLNELTRRKNGEWQCQFFRWHEKKEICECKSLEMINWRNLYHY